MTDDDIPVLTDVVRRGRNNRRRGQNGEREICAILSEAFGFSVKRILGQERDMGHDVNLPPFAFEVKRRKRIANLYEWLDSVEAEGTPVVAMRADGEAWIVSLYLTDFITLIREEVAAAQRKGE